MRALGGLFSQVLRLLAAEGMMWLGTLSAMAPSRRCERSGSGLGAGRGRRRGRGAGNGRGGSGAGQPDG